MTLSDVDALAVTYGPGLVGALLTGVNCMKGLSYTTRLPLIPVNHIEGHVSANFLTTPDLEPPFLCLVVSGGHSHLTRVNAYGDYTLLGQTVDDAAGEAFDKAARVLGLNYPGGPLLSRLAEGGDGTFLPLPHPHPDGRYDFSFSGLKTAFLNACHKMEQKGEALPRADLAANNAYWKQWEGPVKQTGEKVYTTFLQGYGQDLGMRSYGACVDLLVEEFLTNTTSCD